MMVGAIARHPGITAFTAGSVALGTANAVAPGNKYVNSATLGTALVGVGLSQADGKPGKVGVALLGAALVGYVIGLAN